MLNESVKKVVEQEGWGPISKAILEASLSRVLRHIGGDEVAQDEDGVQVQEKPHFAILTSWRKDITPKENKQNWADLNGAIRGAGLGYIRLTGSWLETGSDTEQSPFERSIFVPGDEHKDPSNPSLTLALIQSLGVKYNQDSIIYAGPETERKDEDGNPVRYVVVYNNTRGEVTGIPFEEDKHLKWRHVKLESAQKLVAALENQKRRILAGEKGVFGGGTQVGGRGKGEIHIDGKHASKLDRGASKTSFMFDENIWSKNTKHVFEGAGIKPASLAVRWSTEQYRGMTTLLRHINEDVDYDGPVPKVGCLIG